MKRSKGSKRRTPCNLEFFIVVFPLLETSDFNRQSSIVNRQSADPYFPRRDCSRISLARAGLKIPQEQKRDRYTQACSGARRPSLTQSIILRAKVNEIMPWPHMVESSSTRRSARRSVFPMNPREYSTL